MRNAHGVRDADSVRTERPPPVTMLDLDSRRFHVLGLAGLDEQDREMGSTRLRAERQAHIRQWGVCAGKSVLDVHGEVSPCRWIP